MPFTPAHVAAVLPLRGRLGLPFAALAAGSMSPDLPYFLPFSLSRASTHSLWGIPTWDLLFGMALWMAWHWSSPALHDMAPGIIRRRWPPPGSTLSRWWIVPLAVMIGSATHVLWDSFTHSGYPGATIEALAAIYPSPIGPMPGYRWLQYTSGAVGLAIVAWVGLRQPVRATPPRHRPLIAAFAPALLLAGALLGVAVRVTAMAAPAGRRDLVFTSVTSSISGAGLALVLLCLFHALVAHPGSMQMQGQHPGSR